MEAGVRSGWGSDPIQEVLDQILACSGLTLAQLSGTCPEFEMAVTSSDAAHMLGAEYIVRGVRNASDFDYEYGLSNIMKRFDPRLETVFLPSLPELSCVSATYVRELLKYGFSLEGSVPDCIAELVRDTY